MKSKTGTKKTRRILKTLCIILVFIFTAAAVRTVPFYVCAKENTDVKFKYELTELTVKKEWDTDKHPTEITVELLRNGECVDTAVLSEENGWTYTFTQLDKNQVWTVREISTQKSIRPSYHKDETVVTVKNISDSANIYGYAVVIFIFFTALAVLAVVGIMLVCTVNKIAKS
ncbi:MAG: Cna B-type domain-containing protein [Christensenellaceae bacterium]|nr:Cna B-type domain-containing protein [Christensenellaceae bacterium]